MPITNTRSEQLRLLAEEHLPGGVNSPVRAFRAVGGHPIVFEKAHGCRMIDVDGNSYVDFVASWGPAILGHAHPRVVEAVREAALDGLSFGATSAKEIELAQTIKKFFPSMELLRLTSSGTEAVMSAVRVARGFTGRNEIVKFEGCYHGHSDCLLTKAGSGVTTLGLPDCAGIPPEVAQHTLTVPFNDVDAVEALLKARAVAAVLLEPIAGNMGVVPPKPGFLQKLRELCDKHGALLIFDEVMTGFRVARGGAQELYKIKPDLTCLGKIVGGGMPLAAYGGRKDVMSCVAPLGPVYQAGTLSGNPVATAAGLATLQELDRQPDLYKRLEEAGAHIEERTQAVKANLQFQRVGSMFTLFFTDRTVTDYQTAKTSDTQRYARYFRGMLEQGFYLAPSQFEAAFLGAAHGTAEIEAFLNASSRVLSET